MSEITRKNMPLCRLAYVFCVFRAETGVIVPIDSANYNCGPCCSIYYQNGSFINHHCADFLSCIIPMVTFLRSDKQHNRDVKS